MAKRKIKVNKAMEQGLALAIQTMGSRYALGKALGLSHAACQRWTHVPTDRLLDVEKLTGVAREVLRPDLYR